MAWLVSDGRVLASAELAPDRRARAKGLLGRADVGGALVLRPCRWVHTIGMQFPIDVAYVDADGIVVKTVQMRQRRIGVPVLSARMVIEATAGAFARWGLRVGDVVEIRGDAAPIAHPDRDGASAPKTDHDPGEQRRMSVAASPR